MQRYFFFGHDMRAEELDEEGKFDLYPGRINKYLRIVKRECTNEEESIVEMRRVFKHFSFYCQDCDALIHSDIVYVTWKSVGIATLLRELRRHLQWHS